MSRNELKRMLRLGEHDDSHRFSPRHTFWLSAVALLVLPASFAALWHWWSALPHPTVTLPLTVIAVAGSFIAIASATGPVLDCMLGRRVTRQSFLASALGLAAIAVAVLVLLW
jgi:hypothetical protein